MYIIFIIIVLILITFFIRNLYIDSNINKGEELFKIGDYNNALIYFRKAQKLDSGNSQALLKIGIIYIKLNNYEYAIYEFEESLEKNKDHIYDASIYYFLGYCNEKMGNCYSSFVNFAKYIEIKNRIPSRKMNNPLIIEMSANGNVENNHVFENLDIEKLKKGLVFIKESIKEDEEIKKVIEI